MPLSSVTEILSSSGDYAKLLAELEKFRRNVTVMFTDIRGSTSYFERYGDAAGLLMVNECNRAILGSVSRHGGVVIKTIGDGVMATFPEPRRAGDAAVEIQRERRECNLSKPESDRAYVRIGINFGPGIVMDQRGHRLLEPGESVPQDT